jgi:iron complex outermembrane receptor protein
MDPKFRPFMSGRLRFETETLLNKEIGIKGAYFDDALSIRATFFHMDRDDAQLESWIWDDTNFLWVGYLDSVGSGENYGAELELNYRGFAAFDLFANVGWLQTSIDAMTVVDLGEPGQPTNSTISDISNRDQTKAPEWQYSIGSDLRLTASLSARIEVEGRTDSYFGYYHNQKIDGYALLNASIGYQLEQLNVRIWARNLTDKDYAVHGLYFGNDPRKGYVNESYRQYGEPRVVGINFRYDF